MNLMTGYLGPTSGEILVDGFSVTKEPEKARACLKKGGDCAKATK